MTNRDPLYRRHRFPAKIIAHAVWLYFRFPLSLRMVEGHRKLNDRKAIVGGISSYVSCSSDLRPHVHSRRAQFAMVAGGNVVAGDVEEVCDWVVDGDEAL